MYRKFAAASILAAALAGLTACGSPTAATKTTASTPTAASPAAVKSTAPVVPKSTAPKPLTIAEAGKAYLAVATPRNKAIDKWNADLAAEAPMKTMRADAVRAREAERRFLDVLDDTLWPKNVAGNAESLVLCTAESLSWWANLATATRRSQITDGPTCGGTDAQLIRARLKLPSQTN
jgi:hypothetical protein